MFLDRLLDKYGCNSVRHINKFLISCYVIDICEEGAHEFNQYYHELVTSGWNIIKRTKTNSISISKNNFNPPMWDVSSTYSCVELTVIGVSKALRIQFRQKTNKLGDGEERKIYGRQAFDTFMMLCAKQNINLSKYALQTKEEAFEAKSSIPRYLIKETSASLFDKVLENCHHIDFHSSFPAGLCNTHPEFKKVIEPIYEARKDDPINKAILNYSIGFMQSIKGCGARWAHLSKDAITDNNKRVMEMYNKLLTAGRKPLLLNTDGIWYQGEIYHGAGEGNKLGQWENDHTDCTLRIKSRGAYEFTEKGKYYPVLRGYTNLDKIKPRSEWVWGDIYQPNAQEEIKFYWTEDGLTNAEGEIM